MTEKQIEKDILTYVNLNPGCYGIKLNRTGMWDPVRQVFRTIKNPHIPKGLSDLLLFVWGVPVFVEVKKPKEFKEIMSLLLASKSLLSTRDIEQNSFLQMVIKFGCYGIYACSIHEVEEVILMIKEQIVLGRIENDMTRQYFQIPLSQPKNIIISQSNPVLHFT